MEVRFSSRANSQLSLFFDLGLKETGFLIGKDLGKYKIIESLIPIRFNKKKTFVMFTGRLIIELEID